MASKDNSDEQLIKKLQAEELTKCEHAKLKLKSDVYNSFTLIFDKNKEVDQAYVIIFHLYHISSMRMPIIRGSW